MGRLCTFKMVGEEDVRERRNCPARIGYSLGPFVYDILGPTYFVFGKFLKNCAYDFKTYAGAFNLVGFIICFRKLKMIV
jgi:hypothetical protein